MPDQAPASPNTTDNDALLQLLAQRLGVPRMQAASQAAPATPQSNVVPFRSKQQVEQELNALQPPQAPTLKQIPTQAPAAEYTPIFKAMSPGMMLLATLAGAFTRNPMTSAVQNAGEFLKGVHEGDQELAADKLKKFNADVDAATKSNNEATQQYKLALDQYGNNTAKLQNELVGIALRNNDDPVKALIEAGQYKDAIGLIEARDKMAASIQEHKDTLALRVEGAGKPAALVLSSGETVDGFYNPYTGFTDLSGNAIAKTDVKHFYLGVPAEGIITDSTAQRAAEMAVDKGDYRDAVASAGGFGNVGNINRGKIANAITEYATKKGMSGADISAKVAQFHEQMTAAAAVGRIAGTTAQGAEEIGQLAPLVKAASDKIDRTRFPKINDIELAVEKGTGSPDVVQLNSYIQSIRNAYVQVMSRGGRLTDVQRRYASELIDGSLATGQIDAALRAITTEASVAQSSAERATQQVTGQPVTAPKATQTPAPDESTNIVVPWK